MTDETALVRKSVLGKLTDNARRWKNRAHNERNKRQKWRKRALVAEAEVKRLAALVGQHDPTGADHMEEMWVHAQRADQAEVHLRAVLDALGLERVGVGYDGRGSNGTDPYCSWDEVPHPEIGEFPVYRLTGSDFDS
jgi:hypothetical protein